MYTLIDFRTNSRLVRNLSAALGLAFGLFIGVTAANAGQWKYLDAERGCQEIRAECYPDKATDHWAYSKMSTAERNELRERIAMIEEVEAPKREAAKRKWERQQVTYDTTYAAARRRLIECLDAHSVEYCTK